MSEQVQVQVQAGWWRQRSGDIVRVWRNDQDADYPWESANSSYMENGAVFAGFHDGSDLVEFLGVDDLTRQPSLADRRELVRQFAVALLTRHGDTLAPYDVWRMAAGMADAEPKDS